MILSFNQTYLDKGFSEIDLRSRKVVQLSVTQIEESCTFSRAAVGDMVKMLLPSYQKIFNFVKTDTSCLKMAKICEKTFTKTVT